MDETLGIALAFPAVVNVDVLVASGFHSARNHRVRLCADSCVADLAGKMIPTVPAHGRRLCKLQLLRKASWRGNRRGKQNSQNQKWATDFFPVHRADSL